MEKTSRPFLVLLGGKREVLEFLGGVQAFPLYLGGVMIKLTKHVHKMVQNRPKSSFFTGGSINFPPILRGVHVLIPTFRGGGS